MHTISDKRLLMLRPEEIITEGSILRKEYNEYELKLLACSISVNGIIVPLSVRKNEEGRYILITGHRRLKAAAMAGIRRIPCLLYKIDEPTAALYAVLENLQRKDPAFFDEAKAIRSLLNQYGFSHSDTAAALGIPQNALAAKIGLLRLDPMLQERIDNADLTEAYAKALLRLPGVMRDDALDMIIAEGMTPRQAEDYVNQRLEPTTVKPITEKPIRKVAIGDVRLFSNSLSKLLLTLQSAGVNASFRKYETDRYIEFKIKITKEQPKEACAEQLKIC